MKREQLTIQMRQQALNSSVLEHKMKGVLSLFTASVLDNDGTSTDRYRAQVHDILDAQLDSIACSMALSKALLEASE